METNLFMNRTEDEKIAHTVLCILNIVDIQLIKTCAAY